MAERVEMRQKSCKIQGTTGGGRWSSPQGNTMGTKLRSRHVVVGEHVKGHGNKEKHTRTWEFEGNDSALDCPFEDPGRLWKNCQIP